MNLTNRKWFSVVCTLMDNDIRHHSGQNAVDSQGAVQSTDNAEPLLICLFQSVTKIMIQRKSKRFL